MSEECTPSNSENTNSEGAPQETMEVFGGDVNTGAVMLVLLLLGLMNYAMRDPCTC